MSLKQQILLVACAALIFLGFQGSAIGPALDDLAANNNVGLGDIGLLITASFVGSLIAQFVAGPLNDRIGPRPVLLLGVILLASGTLLATLTRRMEITLLFGVMWGVGFGALDITSNLMVATTYRGNVGVMNLLHVFFGIGAVIGPVAVSIALDVAGDAIPALWVAAGLTLTAIPFVVRLPQGMLHKIEDITPRPAPNADALAEAGGALIEAHAAPRAPQSDTAEAEFSYTTPLVWMLGLLLGIYVGMEVGIGNWAKAYMERSTSLGEADAARVASAFWFALTGGRIAGAVWGNRFSAAQVMWIALGGAAAGSVLLVLSTGNIPLTIAAFMIIGFFFGPPYPTVMTMTTDIFRRAPGRAAGLIAAIGGLGGALFPWLQGLLLDHVSPASSMIFEAAGIFAMLALFMLVQRLRPRPQSDAARDAALAPSGTDR